MTRRTPHPANAHVEMVRDDLRSIPRHGLPEGFALRLYRPGDEAAWVAIHQDADRLQAVTLDTFRDNFASDLRAMEDRCFFLVAPDGREVGTGTAWYDADYRGRPYGRVHWICIAEAYQGRGLAKPLLSTVLLRLARSHDRCCLSTSTARIAAINLYLKFGFRPAVRCDRDAEIWLRFLDDGGLRI